MTKKEIINAYINAEKNSLSLIDAAKVNYKGFFPRGTWNIEDPEDFIILTTLEKNIFADSEKVLLTTSLSAKNEGENIIEVDFDGETLYYALEDFVEIFADKENTEKNIEYIDVTDERFF